MDSKTKTGPFESTLRKSSPGSLGVPKPSRIMTKSEPNSPPSTRLSLDRSPANRPRKVLTPPEKTRTRSVIGTSESSQLKEDLRKANELIESLEKGKDLLYENLYKGLEDKRMAEEKFGIEKFKAFEAGIETVKLKKELEIVKNQHASDSAVLLLATRELEKVTKELAASNDAKNVILNQSENASKMVSIHAKKLDVLSSELIRLKDSTREKETVFNKEIAVLKSQLEKARSFHAEVKKRDRIIEKLDGEIEVLKMDVSYAHGSAEQWSNKVIELEIELKEANMMKRTASNSLASLTKELEESNKRLHAVETEMTHLKVTAKSMETVRRRQCQDLGKSQQLLETAEESLSKAEKDARKLKAELETVKEEKSKILSELESSKEEEEIAMQSLASALYQAKSEARELKEKLLSLGGQDYETQLEHYKKMLDEARLDIDVLVAEVEQTKMREAGLVNHVKKFDEEVSSMGKEMNRLGNLVKRTKEEADGALKKESQMRDDLKEVEDEVSYLQETLREARAESLKLNAKMLDKETEFQSVLHENDLLRVKQDDSLKKIKELEEALAKKHELSESEQDYDLVEALDGMNVKLEENREVKEDSSDDDDDDTVEVEYSMLESYHTGKKEDLHKGK